MKNSLLSLIFFSIAIFSSAQLKEGPVLELIYTDSTYQLTGVAVSQSGRVFTNYPLWSDAHKYSLVEVLPDKKPKPYPNEAMNEWKPGESGASKWVCVQAVYIDDANTMWVVDPASPKQQGVYQNSHKLAKINMATNTIEKVYPMVGTADKQSYLNDVRVDTALEVAYITNSSEGGIIIVNLVTGKSRQVLQGHPSVISDPEYTLKIDGKEVKKNGAPLKVNSDGIALSPDKQYLYYKPLTDNKLYRIKTSFLRDESLTAQQLGEKVEYLGKFTTTDGMEFDNKGNLYFGDLENYRVMMITPDLKMNELIKDNRLIWPDSYHISKDGYLYISCSQIHKQPPFNNGENKRTSPYTIYRVKLP